MIRVLSLIRKAIRRLVNPPTWESISDQERLSLLSLNVEKRKQLGKAMRENSSVHYRISDSRGGHASALDTGGTEGADAGGALGNVLGDMRREMIREAMREGERNGR
jgi:hypothetical protein